MVPSVDTRLTCYRLVLTSPSSPTYGLVTTGDGRGDLRIPRKHLEDLTPLPGTSEVLLLGDNGLPRDRLAELQTELPLGSPGRGRTECTWSGGSRRGEAATPASCHTGPAGEPWARRPPPPWLAFPWGRESGGGACDPPVQAPVLGTLEFPPQSAQDCSQAPPSRGPSAPGRDP